jgi:membrane-anchored protein YejM (alkaline phosphatase superfamily)
MYKGFYVMIGEVFALVFMVILSFEQAAKVSFDIQMITMTIMMLVLVIVPLLFVVWEINKNRRKVE